MAGSMLRLSPAIMAAGLALAGCSGSMPSLSMPSWGGGDQPPPPQTAAPVGPPGRPSIAPDDIVGRWGIASFHRPEDQARTEVAARNGCTQPYLINRGSAGVAMLGHDSPQVQDMVIKATSDGHTFIGPGPDPGGADDREVVSFDGRVLVLKWVDAEVAGRYGTMLLVRCPAPGTAKVKKKKTT
ncbi:MAG TPA: hypothetical protein VII40_13505 [Xanthobacteraceae bacterium]